MEEGVSVALKTGTDLICGNPRSRVKTERDAILQAVQQGLMTQADLDRALRRLFSARFRLGMFDPPSLVPYSNIAFDDNDSEAHRQLSVQAVSVSLVLQTHKNHFPLIGK